MGYAATHVAPAGGLLLTVAGAQAAPQVLGRVGQPQAGAPHQVDSMRDCLADGHDVLVTHTNIDFWNSPGGS